MVAIIATAIGVFAGTNIDDLVVLTALFGSGQVSRRQIVTGQYLGMAAIVTASIVVALGLLTVPDRWVGLFGIVPIVLGVRALRTAGTTGRPAVTSWRGVATVTIANGGDNVAVFTTLFRKAGLVGTLVYVAVFAVLVVVWLLFAAFLSSRRPIAAALEKWGRWIVPIVLIVVGAVLVAGAIAG
jgi:cadmium resistance protein CadD (predicted permease)